MSITATARRRRGSTTAGTRVTSARHRRAVVLVASSLGLAVVQLDVSVVNVAVKPIGEALGADVSALQWVVNAYTLPFAALILSFGALGDRVGVKRFFAVGFAFFGLASAACAMAPSLIGLIVARALQGVGAAALVPCSLTLLNHTFPEPAERVRALGFWAAGGSAALSAGPLLGGVLTSAFGWRAIFFINVPIAVAGVGLTLRFAGETTRTPRPFDFWGQLTSIVGLTVLVAATIEGGRGGFADPWVLAGYGLAAIVLALFAFTQVRVRHPMFPPDLLRGKARSALPIGLVVNVTFYGMIFALSLFFQAGQGHSVLVAGLEFAPMTAAIMAANLVARQVSARIGEARTIAVAALLIAVAAVAMLGVGSTSPYPAMLAPLVATGFGLGLIVPVMAAAMLGGVAQSRSGIASGALNCARQSGSVVGVAVYGALVAAHGPVAGLHLCLAISAILALVVCALGVAMQNG